MKRTHVFVVVALLVAGTAYAQCPGPMQMGMQQGPMGSMMGALDSAVWGDYVYVLQGNMLEKRDMDGNAVKSVELTDMEQTMEEMEAEGVCPVCGMPMDEETRAACPGAMMGEGQGMGQMGGMHGRMMQGQGMDGQMMQGQRMRARCPMMGDEATERGMRSMQRGQMYSKVKLMANEDGVYLLRGGKFTKFDHDLNQAQSWQAVSDACLARDDSVQCAMRQMDRAKCPTCRMMMGTLVDERGIRDGTVTMWSRPARLTPGPVRFQVQVDDLSGRGDADANVNAYLYPKGNVNAGMGVEMQSVGGGHFYGMADIPGAGQWELSLRVMRPGMEDVKVYYDIPVE